MVRTRETMTAAGGDGGTPAGGGANSGGGSTGSGAGPAPVGGVTPDGTVGGGGGGGGTGGTDGTGGSSGSGSGSGSGGDNTQTNCGVMGEWTLDAVSEAAGMHSSIFHGVERPRTSWQLPSRKPSDVWPLASCH